MPERRGARFLVEVLFLAALATALGFARLSALEIVGAMALGWVVVAALEWAAWRSEPHYGSGLPPKYYVPGVHLPPAQPLEQVDEGYPGASREEAPTWIASAALRAEVLGAWPLSAPVEVDEEDEDEDEPELVQLPARVEDPWTVAELPAAPLADEPEEELAPVEVRSAAVPQVIVRRTGERKALYRFDPLGPEAPPRRRFRRGAAEPTEAIEVDAGPLRPRPLPSQLR